MKLEKIEEILSIKNRKTLININVEFWFHFGGRPVDKIA